MDATIAETQTVKRKVGMYLFDQCQEIEILDCPVCGGTVAFEECLGKKYIYCIYCGCCSMQYKNIRDVIACWNSMPAIDE